MSTPGRSLPGQDTLLGCWRVLARLSPSARVVQTPALAAAVFPRWAPLNNAIVLAAHNGYGDAVSVTTSLFAEAGVDAWALWIPSRVSDFVSPDGQPDLPCLTRDTTTLVMQARLPAGLRRHGGVSRTSLSAAAGLSDDHLMPIDDLPAPDALPGLDAWVMVHDEVAVSSAWSFLHGTDCGVYAVETLPGWRRRGLARALVEHVLADAHRRGARTSTLQSTPMGRPLYESLGFRPVGRYEEWVPQEASTSPTPPHSPGA